MNLTLAKFEKRHSIELLRSERFNLERELTIHKNELKRINDEAKQEQPATSPTTLSIVARYARKKGALAARAIREGRGDAGYIRDLADAALFGSATAALLIADITQATKVDSVDTQVVETYAWIRLAVLIDPGNDSAVSRQHDLDATMSDIQRTASRQILSAMEERRNVLLTNPYD